MIKGFWSGLSNCEICIYDRYCFLKCACCYHKTKSTQSDVTSEESLHSQELEETADAHGFSSSLEGYDVIQSPDPTAPVSIVHVPKLPRYYEGDPTNDDDYYS